MTDGKLIPLSYIRNVCARLCLTMSSSNKISIFTESVTLYYKTGYIYLTAKAGENYIAENKLILSKDQTCQFKFQTNIENFSEKLFTAKKLELAVESEYDNILIKGAHSVRLSATKIIQYA